MTTTTTTDRAGLYYLAPADAPRDAYAAGYDANAFATADDAAAAIADLVDAIGGDWIVCRYGESAGAVAARCECGAWSGVRCARVLDAHAVAIDYMPEDLRSSHEVAGYASIAHARAGAERIRVAPECAAEMVNADGEWCAIVGEG